MKAFFTVVLCVFLCNILHAQPKIGDKAPEIAIRDNDGRIQKLSNLKGKVVLVDFWASWCMPCRNSNKEIAPIYNRFARKGFEIYGISLDHAPAAWHQAIAKDGISWLQVMEPGGWEAPTATAWKVEQLPTSYLLDKNGVVISIDPSPEELKKYLQQALK